MKLKRLAAAFVAGMMAMLTLAGCSTVTLEGDDQPAVQSEEVCRVGVYSAICGDYLFTSAWGDCGGDRDLRSLLHGAENVTVVTENTGSSDAETNSPSEDTDKNNPTTGASDIIHAAVMAAIGMLGAAGAVTAKKLGK